MKIGVPAYRKIKITITQEYTKEYLTFLFATYILEHLNVGISYNEN